MTVSNDIAAKIPGTLHYVPDEHIAFLLTADPSLTDVVVAGANQVGKLSLGGAFVLRTRDFAHFTLAPGFGAAAHGRAIF